VTTVAVLCGGVGAARLLRGIVQVVAPTGVAAIVNTADDTTLHGLAISPDLDTIVYTLAGAIDPERGWGLAGESWRAMAALDRFTAVRPPHSAAGTTWFRLGDQDLATHLYRTARLGEGARPTDVAGELGRAWGVGVRLLPMTDGAVATRIELASGQEVPFQDYFVRLRHAVPVRAVRFSAADEAQPTTEVLAALAAARTIVVAPSNPIVSIGPIRSLPGIDELLTRRRDDVVAVSPIVGGAALKGPADRLLAELGHEPSVVGVARLYAPIAATLVIDPADAKLAPAVEAAGMRAVVFPSVMTDTRAAAALAGAVLDAAGNRGSAAPQGRTKPSGEGKTSDAPPTSGRSGPGSPPDPP
jgi:LPPG:FO 2-phospho-L-lactate transferase